MNNPSNQNENFSVKEIEKITGYEDITSYRKGESVPKFTALVNNNKVILRKLDPFLVKDRLEREIEALNLLNSSSEILRKYGFQVPRVVNYWKDKNLLAIEYLEGEAGYLMNETEIENYIKLMDSFKFPSRFDFKNGILKSLSQMNMIPTKYQIEYLSAYERIVNEIQWNNLRCTLIHGDLHKNNLIQLRNGKIGIIDWEYASFGPIEFDITTYAIMSESKLPDKFAKMTSTWTPLVNLMLVHWHLSYDKRQTKNFENWMNRIRIFDS